MRQNAEETGANPRRLRTVLVARFSAIGDVAMTIPVLYSACRCYSDVRFVMITRPGMASMFVRAPQNLTVRGVDLGGEYAGVAGICRLCRHLVAEYRPDAFVDLHNVLRTKLMGFLMRLRGIPVSRLYKPRSKRRALTRKHNKVMLPLTSQRARYREAFFKMGLPLAEHFEGGLFGGRGQALAEEFADISPAKGAGEKWIGIAPFAAHAGKVYPLEKMREVVRRLAGFAGVRVFLFGGGAGERQTLGRWADESECVQSLAVKRYGFGAELALMNHLDVMLSMDSANMHLAAIAGTPTVSIWGATHPYCGFKPWRQTDDDMIQLPVPCRPCSVFGDKPCATGDYLCLNAITPELIVKKIESKLKNVNLTT